MKRKEFLRARKLEAIIFIIAVVTIFSYIGYNMGTANMFNTIMRTAHDLLVNTVFYIMAICVISGAFGKLLIEFGVVRLLESLLSPLMRPIFNLPGVASLGALMTFFSDNPAIISLAEDKKFKSYFKDYELVSLANFGTAFGMGLIVITFMIGNQYFLSTFIGFGGAVIGAIVSTRLMQYLVKGKIKKESEREFVAKEKYISFKSRGSIGQRFLNAVLDGGKQGVDLGLAIIPGVLIISTFIMLITFGAKDSIIGYQGLAYEGVPILPGIGQYFSFIFKILFGFENPELIAFPITSLGAVGAALSLVKAFMTKNIITGNEIAVFTAMGMCWSGYLSTHTAMLDALNKRYLTSRALFSHTIGGLSAGISAHYLYVLYKTIFL
ncbi:MAG: hypothetical protein M0R46_12950 [Candidatus Muirbacterium halophilum]|nr:hypothetical protein [Candidatus Muirbacterium halophilum]MCK9476827.1 hypothetical protein [Candidatus Muirbacterium halophilum]